MQLRVAAYAVVLTDDRVLLSRWSEGRRATWTLPGGGLLDGEDPADAVVREVREETGLDVHVDALLGVDSRVIPARRRVSAGETEDLHTIRIVYRASVVGGVLRDEVDGSTDRAAWFALTRQPRHRVRLIDVALRMAGIEVPEP